ncbi:conserved hypothetical protein [Methylocella silvestris BL2]|uniref:Xanthine dehydrogenase n=1 Tax=Methylocella silvestris (strain DSM 15510 / CIP 108128 / LMG 27833 / NCIMB 13906 / BL2) TaxID=395965 RepID=B8EJ40_METSB|nr:hypothetical protein [Methylocella silvestris]ACK52532.1 conserved hypothetical protein [Methylocella silvestris BL2]
MVDYSHFSSGRSSRPFAVILGVNEVASAIAVHLDRSGWSAALSRDSNPPVYRRGMSFHDALFGDRAMIAAISGERAETGLEVLAAVSRPDCVAVTTLGLLDLLVLRQLDLVIDARLQPFALRPDLRNLARLTIGVGPGFDDKLNCDVAVPLGQPAPVKLAGGATEDSAAGSKNFVFAHRRGSWRTAVDLGSRAFRGFVVGHVGGEPLAAAADGILIGIVRDGTEVVEGDVLAEVDPRTRQAAWTGMDATGRLTAKAVMRALQKNAAPAPKRSAVIVQEAR